MNRRHRRYLLSVVTVATVLCALGLAVNFAVDPLMFAGGNRVFDRNYVFNERLSKVAYYRGRERVIDCVILGSSRMTFLDGRRVGNGCANYAFSGGKPLELLDYLRYLKAMGMRPSRLVVGVDAFTAVEPGEGVPAFVAARQPMASAWSYYFSLDTLRYAFQTLTDTARSPNYYDSGLRKHVGYPTREPGKGYPGDRFYVGDGAGTLAPDTVAVYARMVAEFPDAQWVGVIPPVSQWARQRLRDERVLAGYVAALRALSAPFDRFYDFSWLTDECWDYRQSYDGIHYSAEVWDRYAPRLAASGDPDLIKQDDMRRSATELTAGYRQRVAAMRAPACSPYSAHTAARLGSAE